MGYDLAAALLRAFSLHFDFRVKDALFRQLHMIAQMSRNPARQALCHPRGLFRSKSRKEPNVPI